MKLRGEIRLMKLDLSDVHNELPSSVQPLLSFSGDVGPSLLTCVSVCLPPP